MKWHLNNILHLPQRHETVMIKSACYTTESSCFTSELKLLWDAQEFFLNIELRGRDQVKSALCSVRILQIYVLFCFLRYERRRDCLFGTSIQFWKINTRYVLMRFVLRSARSEEGSNTCNSFKSSSTKFKIMHSN